MPTVDDYQRAMLAAHAAGDEENARRMAQEIARPRNGQRDVVGAVPAPGAPPSPPPAPYDPVAHMGAGERFLAGAGKAFYDVGRGAGQLARSAIEAVAPPERNTADLITGSRGKSLADKLGLPTTKDIEESRKTDAPLMNTGAGMAGNFIGNVAAMAPVALIPGANTVVGGALAGAGTGMLQPVTEDDSRLTNAAMGGAFGAALPAAAKAARTVKAAVIDPLTQKGRERIMAGMLRRAAANPEAAAGRLAVAEGATPGFTPSVGQAAGDSGLAAVERGLRSSNPAAFGELEQSQRTALLEALRGVAGTPEARSSQLAQVNETAKKLYGQAFKENMPVTPELSALARRPSMKAAETRAQKLAAELGTSRSMSLDDLNPRLVATEPRMPAPSSVLADVEVRPATTVATQPRYSPAAPTQTPAERFNPYTNVSPAPAQAAAGAPGARIPGSGSVEVPAARGMRELSVPAEYPIPGSGAFEVPPLNSVPVKDMHTIKMGMDALMGDPTLGIAGQEATAINRTRNALVEQFPESYQVARQAHIDLNRPVHQMDIGNELLNRYETALSRASDVPLESRGNALAEALRGGDRLAKNVTGMKNAKLRSIMTPEQMGTYEGAISDLAKIKAGQTLGRDTGSNTMQNASMQHLAAEAGIPNWLGAVAQMPAGALKKLADFAYKGSDDAVRAQMAEVMADPKAAARLLQQPGPTRAKLAKMLRDASQSGMLALPTIMNAN